MGTRIRFFVAPNFRVFVLCGVRLENVTCFRDKILLFWFRLVRVGRWSNMKDAHEAEPTGEAEEPWLPIETKLVVGSVIAGVVTLIVLAFVVHIFILGK